MKITNNKDFPRLEERRSIERRQKIGEIKEGSLIEKAQRKWLEKYDWKYLECKTEGIPSIWRHKKHADRKLEKNDRTEANILFLLSVIDSDVRIRWILGQ